MDKEISEIAKLTGRISKDPKSKLFVPLAEEYKKAGDIEMAIHVLLEGLKNNPEYVTARSSLGKLLLAKGDLAGAQKEFEAVVKAMPDNFMARKKLGDLLILQSRPLDALPHYKIAQAQNPGDEELASLISGVEAGRDVRSIIQPLKTRAMAEQAVKQAPPAAIAVPEPARVPVPPQPPSVGSKTPVETPPVSPEPSTGTVQAPTLPVTETEEPEEVLVVEPLEPDTSAQEPPAAGLVLTEEQGLRAEPSVVGEETIDFDLPAGDQFSDELNVSQDIQPETELFTVEDKGTIPTSASEEISADEVAETAFGEEVSEKIPQPSRDISAKSDDFTTDTLAELYISQGFFEKAIEIYERMLVDKPNSRGLQDKLSWVRAAAARMGAPVSEEKGVDIFAEQEAKEYVPAVQTGEVKVEPLEELWPQRDKDTAGFQPEIVTAAGEDVPSVELEEMLIEAEVVAEPGVFGTGKRSPEEKSSEDKAASGPKEQMTGGGEAGFNVSVAAPVDAQTGPKSDFEPREYVPPSMDREPLIPASPEAHVTQVPIARRKETIARLETWLKTIKKET